VDEIVQRSTREVYRTPRLRIREDEVVFPDGSHGIYSVIERRGFVVVVAEQNDGFWIVEQYRYPVGERLWEFVAGGWPVGETGDPLDLAKRELLEETGHEAGTWRHLGRVAGDPGIANVHFEVFLATDLTEGEPQRESTEADMVHRWVPDAELRAMVRQGRFAASYALAALALYDIATR
jgi:8-oxo-dGTP pyrophosphatase MutT (NUDIX family)